MSAELFGGLRAQIAAESARVMYEEQVKEYFKAKRIAAKRLLGRVEARRVRFRPRDLPSNGEIREALLALAELAEGSGRLDQLFAMRVVALETMAELTAFHPRLIGSVATGHVRYGSDIDLQVFCDDESLIGTHLSSLRWTFERETASIRKHGEICEYVHYHVADVFPIELTIYAQRELRARPRSSTDGKPIRRIAAQALEALLSREHPESWQRYSHDGGIDGLDAWLSDPGPPGPFDGLLERTTRDEPDAAETLRIPQA